MRKSRLTKNIMRRVYYAYALRLAGHPVTLHGAGIIALLVTLTYFVSVVDVMRNIMSVEVGKVGEYFIGSLLNTEIWTLVILGALILAVLSLRIHLRTGSFPDYTQTI